MHPSFPESSRRSRVSGITLGRLGESGPHEGDASKDIESVLGVASVQGGLHRVAVGPLRPVPEQRQGATRPLRHARLDRRGATPAPTRRGRTRARGRPDSPRRSTGRSPAGHSSPGWVVRPRPWSGRARGRRHRRRRGECHGCLARASGDLEGARTVAPGGLGAGGTSGPEVDEHARHERVGVPGSRAIVAPGRRAWGPRRTRAMAHASSVDPGKAPCDPPHPAHGALTVVAAAGGRARTVVP